MILAGGGDDWILGDIGDDLLCTVCIDIVTDIDSWLTSDTTEDQIVEWMFGLCEVTPLTS